MRAFTISFVFIVLCSSISWTQKVQYEKELYPSISKFKTIDLRKMETKFQSTLTNVEAPPVSGKGYKAHLHQIKESLKTTHPKLDIQGRSPLAMSEPPELINSFFLLNVNPGIPIDNHLAMASDTLVCAGNSFVTIRKTTGNTIQSNTLADFATELDVAQGSLFDPRLLYDPVSERYILVFLGGFDSSDTSVIVAFSASKDPFGEWHAYRVPGNPNQDLTWTDYPMINITDQDLFLTVNLLRDNESWQLGFEESLIWQIPKDNGYAGEELDLMLWKDILFEGKPIRNLCPVESATEEPLESMHFLSNRNFDVETDTFFLLHIDGSLDDPDANLTIDYIISDVPYGVPPNAEQEVGLLQTNDARVLEAFRIQDEIQFVGNTRNLDNNKAGIYHATVFDIFGAKDVSLTHIIGDDYEIGYPGIAYTGNGAEERDAIITFNHTSPTKYAGVSTMYYDPVDGYSEIITLRDGQSYIDRINGELERWGDYLGTQRDYNNPQDVWISGFVSVGVNGGGNVPHVSGLRKPGFVSSTDDQQITNSTSVFPNPSTDWFHLELDISEDVKTLGIRLMNAEGKIIETLYDSQLRKRGKSIFSFTTENLDAGVYYIHILYNNTLSSTEKVIIH